VEFFDRKSREWRAQTHLLDAIKEHQKADQSYMEDGIRILELARRAGDLFDKQVPSEKRRLLNCVLSTASWKDGTLALQVRQPFDMLIDANKAVHDQRSLERDSRTELLQLSNSANPTKYGVNLVPAPRFEMWLPDMDSEPRLKHLL
jgi:hypothetical protein